VDCPLWMLSLSFWQFIDNLLPFLDAGDIIIDGGNSHFLDSLRRTEALEAKGFLFIGTGKPFFRDCPLYPYAHDTPVRAITVRCIRRRARSADGSFNNAGRICGGVENHEAHISGNQRAY
jgi:hypothetical protein